MSSHDTHPDRPSAYDNANARALRYLHTPPGQPAKAGSDAQAVSAALILVAEALHERTTLHSQDKPETVTVTDERYDLSGRGPAVVVTKNTSPYTDELRSRILIAFRLGLDGKGETPEFDTLAENDAWIAGHGVRGGL